MEIAGLPAHVLIVHAAVVFPPLAALVAVAHAVVPRWRWALRWPLVGLAVVAGLSVVAAYFSGESYLEANPGLAGSPAVATHMERGEVMLWIGLVFAVVAVAAALLLGGPTALASGRGARESRGVAVDRGLAVLLVLAAVVALVWVVLTGDAGSRAVWG